MIWGRRLAPQASPYRVDMLVIRCAPGGVDVKNQATWQHPIESERSAMNLRRMVVMAIAGAFNVALVFSQTGCNFGKPRFITNPLSYAEQEAAILEVVPIGTPREAAVKQLEDAGIVGSFGVNDSIFYCDLWERSDGLRWHVNVALLFDQSSKLYKTRPAESDTGLISGSVPSNATARPDSAQEAAEANRNGLGVQQRIPVTENNREDSTQQLPDKASSGRTPTNRSGERSPFR